MLESLLTITSPGMNEMHLKFMEQAALNSDLVICPNCGEEIEIWSDEDSGFCLDCNAEWTKPDKDVSCLDYCEYADTCREIIEAKKTPG